MALANYETLFDVGVDIQCSVKRHCIKSPFSHPRQHSSTHTHTHAHTHTPPPHTHARTTNTPHKHYIQAPHAHTHHIHAHTHLDVQLATFPYSRHHPACHTYTPNALTFSPCGGVLPPLLMCRLLGGVLGPESGLL